MIKTEEILDAGVKSQGRLNTAALTQNDGAGEGLASQTIRSPFA